MAGSCARSSPLREGTEGPMTLSRRDFLALSGIALSGAIAPSLARAQTPKRGGTLTIRGWDPPMFDPMLQTAYRVQIPNTFTHSRLVKHKAGPGVAPATFQIEGDLAESWSQPNDMTSMTYGPQTPFLDPDNFLFGMHYPGEAKNQSHVDDPVVTDLLIRQRRIFDVAKRREVIH